VARKQSISVGGDVLKPPRHLVGVGFGVVGDGQDVVIGLGGVILAVLASLIPIARMLRALPAPTAGASR
jgi:hypothetical protein